jgi:two-component system nitrogen regulation response regulator NtrX
MNSVSKQNSSLPKSTTVLIVDDEKAGRIMSRVLLSDNPGISGPISILEATNIPEALRVLAQTPVDVVLLDKNVGPIEDEVSQDGIESIPEMRALQQYIKILVITSSQKNKDRARAIQLGAFDFIAKSSDLKIKQQKVAEAVSAAHQAFAAILNGRLGTQQLTTSTPLGGKSVLWRRTVNTTQAYALNEFPVLFGGPTGSGKTELARLIHWERAKTTPDKQRAFIAINIAALSSEIAERELFGNEKGAYTGATEANMGYFELAKNGTLFLDEIGDADLGLQKQILTVVEEGRLYRLGGTKEITVNFKLVCASHRNLEKLVEEGKFREDLFMRISTLMVQVPPLSQRTEDIPDMVIAMLPRVCARAGISLSPEDLPAGFIKYLTETPFRGNARGIFQQIARLVAKAPTDKSGKRVLTNWKRLLDEDVSNSAPEISPKALTLNDILEKPIQIFTTDFPGISQAVQSFEDRIYEEARIQFKSINAAARKLGVSPSTAYLNFKRIDQIKK